MCLKIIKIVVLLCGFSILNAAEFTVSSYNCGGLSNHYDYLRAACMEKLMHERSTVEPESVLYCDKIQKLALKRLFSSDRQAWNRFSKKVKAMKVNTLWNKKAESMISSYLVRPVVIYDKEVKKALPKNIDATRENLAKQIFEKHLKFDIICLQEANYIEPSLFPETYHVLLDEEARLTLGIAWKKNRFKLVKRIGDIMGRAYAVKLRDRETGKIIVVVSAHIKGCNPFQKVIDPQTGVSDSEQGDNELQSVVELYEDEPSDLMVIGMDSNVTSLHPRLRILKDAGFRLDFINYLEPTCTNPVYVLNTRIDWIAIKTNINKAKITNIPVLNIGLNNIRTNMSDHKPIAAKIHY